MSKKAQTSTLRDIIIALATLLVLLIILAVLIAPQLKEAVA